MRVAVGVWSAGCTRMTYPGAKVADQSSRPPLSRSRTSGTSRATASSPRGDGSCLSVAPVDVIFFSTMIYKTMDIPTTPRVASGMTIMFGPNGPVIDLTGMVHRVDGDQSETHDRLVAPPAPPVPKN